MAGPDFNGDGYGDLAIGSLESEGADLFRGSMTVLYGTIAGLAATDSQVWTQDSSGIIDTSEGGDLFGASLAAGDFDGDGYADLAVGVQGEDFGPGENDAGAVNVLYGSAVGLTADGNQFWAQNSPGIAEDPEPTDSFSEAMAVGDFDGDGYADLAVGVPWEDISFGGDDGAMHVLFGSATGLTSAGSQYWNQDTPGIPETAEPGDLFGSSLAASNFGNGPQADLAIGVHESVGVFFSAGAVHLLYGSATGPSAANDQIWNQNRPGVEDGAEEADFFGYSLAQGISGTDPRRTLPSVCPTRI